MNSSKSGIQEEPITTTELNGLRCLVLGGTGFIGLHLCQRLAESGAKVRSFAIPPALGTRRTTFGNQIDWMWGDFGDAELVRESLRNIDVVFHLISTSLPASSNEDPRADLSSNVLSTLQMLEAAKALSIQKVIFFSSGGTVYGIPNRTPIPEDHALNPICAYGVHKVVIEKYLYLFHHLWGLNYVVLRPSNAYGPGQAIHRPQGAVAHFVRKMIDREPVEIWGDGNAVRDYIYIDDLIDACMRAVTYDGPSRVFNIGTGKGHTLLELIAAIESLMGEKADIHFRDARHVDVPINILDVSRARNELSWRPAVSLQTGLRLLFEKIVEMPAVS